MNIRLLLIAAVLESACFCVPQQHAFAGERYIDWAAASISVGPANLLAIGFRSFQYDRRNNSPVRSVIWDLGKAKAIHTLADADRPQFVGDRLFALVGPTTLAEFDISGHEVRKFKLDVPGNGGLWTPTADRYVVFDGGRRVAYEGDLDWLRIADLDSGHNAISVTAGPIHLEEQSIEQIASSAGPHGRLLAVFAGVDSPVPNARGDYAFALDVRLLQPSMYVPTRLLRIAPRVGQFVLSAAIWPNGRYAAALDGNGSDEHGNASFRCDVWNTDSGKPLTNNPIWSGSYGIGELPHGDIIFSPDSNHLAFTTSESVIAIFGIPSGKRSTWIGGPNVSIQSIAFSEDGKTIYAGGTDSTNFTIEARWPCLLIWHDIPFRSGNGPDGRFDLRDCVQDLAASSQSAVQKKAK